MKITGNMALLSGVWGVFEVATTDGTARRSAATATRRIATTTGAGTAATTGIA